jgi:hypothetical protein
MTTIKLDDRHVLAAVPASLNIRQKRLIKEDVKKQGIEVRRFVSYSGALGLYNEFYHPTTQQDELVVACTITDDYFEAALMGSGEGIVEMKAVDFNHYNAGDKNAPKYCIETCRRLAKSSGVCEKEVNKVLITGGRDTNAALKQKLSAFFNKAAVVDCSGEDVIAKGAAVQADIINYKIKNILLLDIVARDIGLRTPGGIMTLFIPKNTTIPTMKSQRIMLDFDGQYALSLLVFYGDEDNYCVDRFIIPNNKKKLLEAIEVEVKFDIDADGIIDVSVKNQETGETKTHTIAEE